MYKHVLVKENKEKNIWRKIKKHKEMKTYCQVSRCGFEKKARQCLCVGGFWQKIIITTSKLCVWIFMEDWGRGGKCEERQQREIFCHPRSCVTTATCGLFCNYAQFWRKIPKIHHKIMHLSLVIVASSTAASLGAKSTDFVNRFCLWFLPCVTSYKAGSNAMFLPS